MWKNKHNLEIWHLIVFSFHFGAPFLDAPSAEAVKRKVDDATAKADEVVATPEKKAKLDEASSKDEVQNGAEASEVAA